MSEVTFKSKSLDKVCAHCLVREGSAGSPKLSACARCGLVVYCSRNCQKAHWKANDKTCCVAKADRVPQYQTRVGARKDVAPTKAAATGEGCSIYLNSLSEASVTTLQ
jgi:hypothetical protein